MTSPSPDPGRDPAFPEALDPARFEALRPGLELLALRALGDRELAREAAQETLSRAVAAWARGTTTAAGRLAAFVAGIARHVVTDIRRARARAPVVDIESLSLPSSGPDPLQLLIDHDASEEVRRALAELPAADRELLKLCFFEGLTPTEVAAQLGEPAERIRKRKSRALGRLREIFRGRDGHVLADAATKEAEDL